MAACVESSGGNLEVTSTTIFSAAAFTIVVAYKTTTGGGVDEFRAVFGLRNTTNAKQMFELYEFDDIDTQAFYKATNGTTNVQPSVETYPGGVVPTTWRHAAITCDSDGNPLDIYLIAEGFNQGSPSYIYRNTDTTNGMYNQSGTVKLGVWCDAAAADEDQGNTIRIAHVIVYGSVLSEASILAQFKQRAPTGAAAIYYPCSASASIGTDSSGNGRNATVAHSASFSDVADEPSDWATAVSDLPIAATAAQRVNRNTLLRL